MLQLQLILLRQLLLRQKAFHQFQKRNNKQQRLHLRQLLLHQLQQHLHLLQSADRAWTFLVADDHPVNRLLVKKVLQNGWPQSTILEASEGQQALQCLREQTVDLVLMDMVMPEMDGIEATAHIRQHMKPPMQQVPVILLTANVNAQDHLRGLHAGINALMVKPFDRSKLCALIEEQLLSSATFLQRLAQER